MSSGSAQDVAVENFLRDIERRGQWLHCAVIGCEEEHPRGDMNLLYRKSRLDWRHRDQESKKSSNYKDASSATVGKVRDLASFRRHFRMGFMTMPASQDLSPHSCAAAMAPRSQSCHAVGTGEEEEMENGYYPDSDPQNQSNPSRCPPAKPKRHPNTRLTSSKEQEHTSRGVHAPPETPPPPPPNHSSKHEKRNAMKKSDSGDMSSRKVPPLKPKRSPSTQLSFDPPTPRVPPPTTPLPFQSSEPSLRGEGGDDEPVYIEMVGQVFTRETHSAPTPHPLTPSATTPDSDSDQGEAIYEEMKYPLPDDAAREAHRRLPLKHERIKSSKAYHSSIISSSSTSSSLPRPSSSSPACASSSKPKATVSISHSSPLPSSCSSASSTPVPQPLSSSPHPPRAPTPFLLPGAKLEHEPSTSKIPAPFPNLLQHKPPLLAFPQPAAASSGVGAQHKTSSAKISVQSASSLPLSTSTSSSMSSTSNSKDSSGVEKEREKERKDGQLGPAPGLRARSHSTPLPPSSKSSSPYSHHHHHHHHPHHRPSHYHHYRKPEKESSSKGSGQGSSQSSTQTQTQPKEGKSVSFLLKSEKPDRDRDKDRDRDRERDSSTPLSSHSDTVTSSSYTHTSQTGTSTTPTPILPSSSTAATAPSSSSTQRPPSRSHMHRSHTPHLSHGLPAYKPPPSNSPLLWTYPSVGFRRPPAYDSLRGVHVDPKTGSVTQAFQAKTGFIPWESAAGLGLTDEQAYWPMHRKLSFSHGSRETEKEDVWNGSADAQLRRERNDIGISMRGGGHSGIPVRATGRHSESLAGADGPPGLRGLIRAGLPLPCQTFPACRNGELGRLGRSSSTSGVRQVGGDVQRQSSLPAREVLNQFHALSQLQSPCSPSLSRQQQYQQQVQLQFQQLAQLAAQAQVPISTGTSGTTPTQSQRDGKLLEVIERKRCLCKEIKAHRRPDKSLCKQDSMPILPSWRRTPEPRKTGTPPCQRPQAVVWDTAI
ncbi:neuronal tyrosine-phosphorylated phosphoinositide-3-kinase adapter 1 [Triplophysa rosa]|uniref:Neuronal tyrosine-phosphorylated phosphoinositide-3-kinase adapter 1 n=1 Tax=Triplophysa rosa TaxID=992332 RepID=A0A9W8CAR3_TRIRA|nr:neuronal tyrosine-phosphorylated phosphoinositide-3-kinase adapter 1 [Triplophysa rosa]XP_057217243.1 neuronal tyrosine-phosphorylated phosphoinositide-3-kinase adapter 1 [Triplophysa rosa]XP_057217253.1 neuronal tyrosine-phosphorylated phosphoinositide-3-kinase adapter 1 [Triplophysa rosa]KAI7812638.1 putative neuronal tyrosine-phosphorylated phosphoinositide-3-kinase adapter 1 [Triplophysa rosa]